MAVIYADVLTRLDERSAKAAADELEKQFSDVAARVGATSSDSLGEALKSRMPKHGKDSADSFMDEFVAGLRGGITDAMPPIVSSLSEVSTAMKALGAGGAAAGIAAAAGIGLIAVAAVKAGEALYDVGQRFDALSATLAVRTGKMGADLEALNESIANVGKSTASSLESIADIGGRVSQSLNLSGAPLEDLTKQIADLNRMTGETLNIRQFGQDLRGFGIEGAAAGDALNALTAASQSTGIPLNDLVSTLGNAGPAARQLGMDLDDTAGMIVAFEKAGIDADKTTAGLNRAVAQFADHNINLKTGLQDTVGQIRGFIDAGNDAAAVDLAGKVFGAKSAQAFVDAIKQGTISVQTLKDGLGDTGDTIGKLDDQTSNWREEWDKLKNTASDLANVIGDPLFHALDTVAKKALEFANNLLGAGPGTVANSAPSGGAPGSPFDPQGVFGGPATANQPNSLDSILLPSDVGVPGQVIPPWMDQTAPHTPQDIAAALADPAKKTGLPSAPQLPYEVGYGRPPAAGESQEHWQARMADMAARHDLAEKQARLNQLSASANATADDLISARNTLVEAEMRSYEAHKRLMDAETQKLTPAAIAYPDAYGQGPRAGQTAAQYSAEGSVYESQQKRAQAEANLQQMQASGTATAAKLAEAHNAVEKSQRDEQEATMRLTAAYTDNTDKAKKAKESLSDIGIQLDQDFGMSKGLPGLVENLTKFLAGLAFAPVLGALQAVQAANGGYDAGKMGSGLAGMAGVAAGLGPHDDPDKAKKASGPPPIIAPYHPDLTPTATAATPGGYAAMGTPYGAVPSGMPSGGSYPGDAALLAQVPRGGSYDATGDLSLGLADCTSGIEDLVNLIDGQSTAGRSMDTTNAGEWLSARGFLPNPTGANIPGAFNVGFWDGPGSEGHMEGTLPGGRNVNFGSDAAVASGGTAGAAGAFGDPTFTSHYYRPMTPGAFAGGPAGMGGAMGGGATPVFVVNMPGGGGIGAALGGGIGGAAPAVDGSGSPTGAAAAVGGGGYAPLSPTELTGTGLTSPRPLGSATAGPTALRPTSIGGAGGGSSAGAGSPAGMGIGPAGGGISEGIPLLGGGGTGTGIGPGMAGLPQSAPFGAVGGRSAPSNSVTGGRAWGSGTPASAGLGFGGGVIGMAGGAASGAAGLATSGAAMGMDGGMGGAAVSAAMQIGIQEIQRAAGAVGQYAGAAVGGLMETFSLNDSALGDPSRSWLGKIAGAAAGVRPALPNAAGGEGKPMAEAGKEKKDEPPGPPGPLTPEQADATKAADAEKNGGSGGTTNTTNNNVNVTNQGASEDYTGQTIQAHLGAQAMAGQPR
jgi:hypothetical protein